LVQWFSVLCISACFLLLIQPALGQTAGEAAISGMVTDGTHASISGATVTAHNVQTGVDTSRVTSSSGLYQISPLIVGTYTVTVSATGFETLKQESVVLAQNQILGFNPVLKVGNQKETVTVTDAPPSLDTVSAELGSNIEAQEFMDLPVLMNSQQRDITSFSNLLPGAQAGSRSSLFSGTANRVQEVYLDGIPLTTISQIGDNRPIFNVIPSDAIGEIGALTSGQSVEYQGAGSVNYNMKSGGNNLHGAVADYVRNTAFDTWGFTAPGATKSVLVNGVVTSVPADKPMEHQNELSISAGGPIVIPHVFDGHNKLFWFGAYDKAHSRNGVNPASGTVPTTKMRGGDFSELLTGNNTAGINYVLYDPTSQAACTQNSTTGPCRYAFGQVAGTGQGPNGNPSGTITNVIPSGLVSMLSPISKQMESFLPQPINSSITSNYLGGVPNGYDNWLLSARIDYTVSPKQTIAGTFADGHRVAWPYTSSSNEILPLPYLPTTFSTVVGHWYDLSDSYTFTSNLVNQLKYGYSYFGGPPIRNITQGVSQYEATAMGIGFSGLPANSQALTEFPTVNFAGSNAQTQWGEGSSGVTATTVTNTHNLVDNLLWLKGKHAITVGIQMQWLEENADTADGPTNMLQLNYATAETSGITETLKSGAYVPSYTSGTGYSYASFMLGAVNGTGLTYQPFSVVGGRYHTVAPYIQDTFTISPKLTLTLGLRWDYIPTYREAKDRWSFLNPTLTNPLTGNPGALQFAGSWGGSGVSCNCRTPVSDYMKNYGPRAGLAYSINNKTVVRAGYSLVYSHAGGTGGAGGAYNGTGNLGFSVSPSWADGAAGPSAGPAFYLNNGTGFTAAGIANTNLGGAGYAFALSAPGAISQTLNVGNTVDANGNYIAPGGAPGYADPYLSGRAPEFSFWNFGVQRELTSNMTLTVNYAGSESHFISGASNMRGLQAGQIDPKYLQLGSLLSGAATATNLAAANTAGAALGLPAITAPYANFSTAAGTSGGAGKATIARALTWMPQFSGSTDTWPVVANANYHSLQVSLAKRMSKGLVFNFNYTYSKNIDDTGTQRSGYAIPATALLSGKSFPVNRIDRSISPNSVPNSYAFFGNWKFPALAVKAGGGNPVVKWVVNDWSMAWVATYVSGTPLYVTADNGCANAGTCMPDVNPNYRPNSIRANGKWGQGALSNNLGKYNYLNGYINTSTPGSGSAYSTTVNGVSTTTQVLCAASTNAYCNAGVASNATYMIGDAPRWSFGLRNPSVPNLNLSVRRTFPLVSDRLKFQFAADCTNVANKVTFGGIKVDASTSNFGQVTSASGNRDFQFSGRVIF
jgi:hypothetical protein